MADISTLTIGNVNVETIFIFLLVFILTVIIGNIMYFLTRKLLDNRTSQRVSKTISRIVEYLFFALGIYIGIYHVLGLNLTAIGASLGILSIAIAFSSQQIIQNFIAGILITLQRPILLEDWVEIGLSGLSKVKDLTLARTLLRDINGRLISIPNSVVLSSNIINYTKSGFTQLSIPLTLPADKYEKTKKIIFEILNENPKILPNIPTKEKTEFLTLLNLPHIKRLFESKIKLEMFEPKIYILEITESKLKLSIRVWIKDIQFRDTIISEVLDELALKMKKDKLL